MITKSYKGFFYTEYLRPEFILDNDGFEFSAWIEGRGRVNSRSLRGIKSIITRSARA